METKETQEGKKFSLYQVHLRTSHTMAHLILPHHTSVGVGTETQESKEGTLELGTLFTDIPKAGHVEHLLKLDLIPASLVSSSIYLLLLLRRCVTSIQSVIFS